MIITVECHNDDPPSTLLSDTLADQSALLGILLSLLINARQAMPQGGNLYVETKNCFLDKSWTRGHKLPTESKER